MIAQHKLAVLEKTESNRSAYRKTYKAYLANTGAIFCRMCPYHRRENVRRHQYTRNWKQFRKMQYKS